MPGLHAGMRHRLSLCGCASAADRERYNKEVEKLSGAEKKTIQQRDARRQERRRAKRAAKVRCCPPVRSDIHNAGSQGMMPDVMH